MDVKQRLTILRRQSGAVAEPQAPVVSSVAERIRRLRPSSPAVGASSRSRPESVERMEKPDRDLEVAPIGRRGSSSRSRMDESALAEHLGGARLAAGLILVTRRVPLASHHGNVCLAELPGRSALLPDPEDGAPERWLLVDTETSGLAGGTGTIVFLLGLARLDGDALETRQYLLSAFAGEAALYEHAGAWLGAGRTLLSFNGKSFDLPLLAARARMARVCDPFAGLAHLDLLHATRRVYARRWSDCRLGTAERCLLGFERADDLPGAEAPAVWLDWVRRGDGSRMGALLRHNHWDLVSLAALALRLGQAYREPGLWGADALAAARAWELRGRAEQARGLLEAHRSELSAEGLLELARLYRRRGAWDLACEIWRPLSAQRNAEACEQLAKYHEHVARDYPRALDYANRLPGAPQNEHRRKRLEAKLARSAPQPTLLS